MRILPMNTNYQQTFGAKLPKSQIGMVKEAAQNHDSKTGIPKMYTILQELDKMAGKNAELKKFPLGIRIYDNTGFKKIDPQICQIRIDGKLIQEGDTVFETLYNAVTSKKDNGKKISMPKEVFDKMWKKNSEKTAEDMEQFFRD